MTTPSTLAQRAANISDSDTFIPQDAVQAFIYAEDLADSPCASPLDRTRAWTRAADLAMDAYHEARPPSYEATAWLAAYKVALERSYNAFTHN